MFHSDRNFIWFWFNGLRAMVHVRGLDTSFSRTEERLAALDLAEDFAGEEDGVVDDGLELGRGSDGFAAEADGGDNRGGNDEDGVSRPCSMTEE